MRHRNTWLKLLLLTASVTPASGLADLRLAPRLRRATPHRLAPARLPTQQQPRCSAALLQIAWDPKLLAVSLGGVFAGGLHSVTGPDHLAALLPICIGKRWWLSIYTGLYWGLGHGIGAALVGALAFAVRGALNVDLFSTYMEAAVGISIMVIGLSGIAEAREWSREHDDGPTESNAHHDLDVILESDREQSAPCRVDKGTGTFGTPSGGQHALVASGLAGGSPPRRKRAGNAPRPRRDRPPGVLLNAGPRMHSGSMRHATSRLSGLVVLLELK